MACLGLVACEDVGEERKERKERNERNAIIYRYM
jgi:hypothetical protein